MNQMSQRIVYLRLSTSQKNKFNETKSNFPMLISSLGCRADIIL